MARAYNVNGRGTARVAVTAGASAAFASQNGAYANVEREDTGVFLITMGDASRYNVRDVIRITPNGAGLATYRSVERIDESSFRVRLEGMGGPVDQDFQISQTQVFQG